MRFYYVCGMCGQGFWYDKEIHDNNVECLHCESSGHETVHNADLGVDVPKLFRVGIWTEEDGSLELPSTHYECGKCKTTFGVPRWRKRSRCPKCEANQAELTEVHDGPNYTIPQHGNHAVDTSVYGEDARPATVKQISIYKRETGDEFFRNTDSARNVCVPKRDPDTGKVRMVRLAEEVECADLPL